MAELSLPEKMQFLWKPARYKIAFGGRGGAKTESFAKTLVVLGAYRGLRVGCFREFQNSIEESVYQVLVQQIYAMELEHLYDIGATSISGKDGTTAEGTRFFFRGLSRNPMSIKSIYGIDVAWIEEAQTVSKRSWDILEPTIRDYKEECGPFGKGVEIWISFNPELETDETYSRFVKNKPTGSVIVKINHTDNPWFPANLNQQRLDMMRRDPVGYKTIWEGECRQTLDGSIFANELRIAKEEGRITTVDYDKSKPVDTYWDLGRHDFTAIWFVQTVGMRFNIIDFYHEHQESMPHFIKEMKDKKYNYGTCYLPHDGSRKTIVSERSPETILRTAGFNVRLIPRVSKKSLSISAARVVFDQCYFDRNRCSDGLNFLARYRYEVDENGQFTKDPYHDINSDAADAFQQLGLKAKPEAVKKKPVVEFGHTMPITLQSHPQGWMS